MGNKVTIIDYGYGNLYSLQSAFNKLKINSVITELPEVIEKAEIIVLPGVGSFYQAMKAIKKRELHIIIKKAVRKNKTIIRKWTNINHRSTRISSRFRYDYFKKTNRRS